MNTLDDSTGRMGRADNRFQKARREYNQHGEQAVATVAKETGVSKSLIDDLEAVTGSPRGVKYQTVAKLAKHYGVSADYLLGLSDVPTQNRGGGGVVVEILDTGYRTPMGDTGFVRDSHAGKGRMDLLPWSAILEVSQHCEAGAIKYGERNIDKGAPLHSLLDSGARHLAKYIRGDTDEDHLRAACWNLLWALEQRSTHPELNDMPWGKNDGQGRDRRACDG